MKRTSTRGPVPWLLPSLAIALSFSLAACEDDASTPVSADAGARADGAPPADGAAPVDSGADAAPAPTGPTLMPGPGFSGPTPEPPPVGSGTASDRRAIAHWDVVPYQTVSDRLSIGVLAYHFNGIDRVEISLGDGPWVVIDEPTLNPATGAEEYQATLDASLVPDGDVEIRAIAYPIAGVPRVLQGAPSDEDSSLLLSTNSGGTLASDVRYALAAGDDANDCTSADSACQTIARAIESGSRGVAVDGLEIRLGEGAWVLPSLADGFEAAFTNEHRWLTITSAPGASPDRVVVAGVEGPDDGAGMWLKLVHLANVTVSEAATCCVPGSTGTTSAAAPAARS